MWRGCSNNAEKMLRVELAFFAALASLSAVSAQAESFTAGTVMQKMEERERYAFVAGVVEGLAFARYKADGDSPAGMSCIYTWFYHEDGAVETVYAAFRKFPDNTPVGVVSALIRRRCDG